jgi:hypothetical protein
MRCVRDESFVLEDGAGGPHLDDCLREILVMFLKPFEMSVFMLQTAPSRTKFPMAFRHFSGKLLRT